MGEVGENASRRKWKKRENILENVENYLM